MPGSMKLFNLYRSDDTNIEVGIGSVESEMPFLFSMSPH